MREARQLAGLSSKRVALKIIMTLQMRKSLMEQKRFIKSMPAKITNLSTYNFKISMQIQVVVKFELPLNE